jgi:hypothetical protein
MRGRSAGRGRAGVDDYESLSLPNRLPDATDEARFEAIRKFADEIFDATAEEFREELRGGAFGSDEFQPLVALVRELAIGANPGLKAALERLSADPFAFRAAVHFQQPEHQDHPLRATVASTLF